MGNKNKKRNGGALQWTTSKLTSNDAAVSAAAAAQTLIVKPEQLSVPVMATERSGGGGPGGSLVLVPPGYTPKILSPSSGTGTAYPVASSGVMLVHNEPNKRQRTELSATTQVNAGAKVLSDGSTSKPLYYEDRGGPGTPPLDTGEDESLVDAGAGAGGAYEPPPLQNGLWEAPEEPFPTLTCRTCNEAGLLGKPKSCMAKGHAFVTEPNRATIWFTCNQCDNLSFEKGGSVSEPISAECRRCQSTERSVIDWQRKPSFKQVAPRHLGYNCIAGSEQCNGRIGLSASSLPFARCWNLCSARAREGNAQTGRV